MCSKSIQHKKDIREIRIRNRSSKKIELSEKTGLIVTPVESIQHIAELFTQKKIENERSERALDAFGIHISAPSNNTPEPLVISIDPCVIDIAFPLIELATRKIKKNGVSGTRIRFDFLKTVENIEIRHKLTGKFYDTDVKLTSKEHFSKGDIQFFIGHLKYGSKITNALRKGKTYVSMKLLGHCIPLEQIRGLIEFLFEREVLYFGPEYIRSITFNKNTE